MLEAKLSLNRLRMELGLTMMATYFFYDEYRYYHYKQNIVLALGILACVVFVLGFLKRRRLIKLAAAELEKKIEIEKNILADKVDQFDETSVEQLDIVCDLKWFFKVLMLLLGACLSWFGVINDVSGLVWSGGIVIFFATMELLPVLLVRNNARLRILKDGVQFGGWPLVPWGEITKVSVERIPGWDGAARIVFETHAWERFRKTLGWLSRMRAGPGGTNSQLVVFMYKSDYEPELILKIANGLISRYAAKC